MIIADLKALIDQFESQERSFNKLKRKRFNPVTTPELDQESRTDNNNIVASNIDQEGRLNILKKYLEYLEKHKATVFSFVRFYEYVTKTNGRKWAEMNFSLSVLSIDKGIFGELFKRWWGECSAFEKFPPVLRKNHIYPYLTRKEISSMVLISHRLSKEIKNSKHYEFLEDRHKWKKKLIELKCDEKTLNTVFEDSHYIKNPKHLFDVLNLQKKYIDGYKEPWAFYLFSGELPAANYAIIRYELNDSMRPIYGESPFHLAVFSQEYRAVELVMKHMKVNFKCLTSNKHTPLHLAGWSNSTLQLKYVRLLIHKLGLYFTPEDKAENNKTVLQYIEDHCCDNKQNMINALNQPLEEIDTSPYVDENNEPIFKNLFRKS